MHSKNGLAQPWKTLWHTMSLKYKHSVFGSRTRENSACLYNILICIKLQVKHTDYFPFQVKKVGLFRIAHDRSQQGRKNEAILKERVEAFDLAIKFNAEVSALVKNKYYDVLNPVIVHELLKRIPDDDIPLLLMNPEVSRPEDLILTRIFVPPICIRPSVVSDLKVSHLIFTSTTN